MSSKYSNPYKDKSDFAAYVEVNGITAAWEEMKKAAKNASGRDCSRGAAAWYAYIIICLLLALSIIGGLIGWFTVDNRNNEIQTWKTETSKYRGMLLENKIDPDPDWKEHIGK